MQDLLLLQIGTEAICKDVLKYKNNLSDLVSMQIGYCITNQGNCVLPQMLRGPKSMEQSRGVWSGSW